MNNILSIACFDKALEKKNMNLTQLANAYNEKYPSEDGKTIYNTLRNWHQGKGNPTLEKLIRICDILECDVDFILGRLDNSTHNAEYICDTLGLTEESVNNLIKFTTYEIGKQRLNIINSLLCNSDFTHFFTGKLLQYQEAKRSYLFYQKIYKKQLNTTLARDALNCQSEKMNSILFHLHKMYDEIIEYTIESLNKHDD